MTMRGPLDHLLARLLEYVLASVELSSDVGKSRCTSEQSCALCTGEIGRRRFDVVDGFVAASFALRKPGGDTCAADCSSARKVGCARLRSLSAQLGREKCNSAAENGSSSPALLPLLSLACSLARSFSLAFAKVNNF